LPYFNLARRVKHRAKRLMQYISHFGQAVATDAKLHGANGVGAGHIHYPEMTLGEDGILYVNFGDWVESRTLLAEDFDGNLWLLYYCSQKNKLVPIRFFDARQRRILPPPAHPAEEVLINA
jgi:UDP-2,3-diacylglucosamine pyrophosphatase LpxH